MCVSVLVRAYSCAVQGHSSGAAAAMRFAETEKVAGGKAVWGILNELSRLPECCTAEA